jgi:autotransporter-associated beta strand protein
MSYYTYRAALCAAVSLGVLSQAQAHTTSVGYENAGPGAVNFWYGTYHGGTTFTEGSFSLVGQDVTYTATVPFTLITSTKPTGLIDGDTNFYSDGSQLTGVDTSGGIFAWQGVSFTDLVAGTYVFTYIPIATPTATWQPIDNIILSSQVTLTAAVLGGGGSSTPAEPSIIDGSQSSFSENSTAAGGSQITFDGGVFAPTQTLTLDKGLSLLQSGGTIDASQGDLSLSGVIEGVGGLTKSGSGALILSGANTYAGGTQILGGTLVAQNGGALGSGVVTGSGGTLQFGYSGAFVPDIGVGSGGLSIDTLGGVIQASGAISGSGNLTKTGEGVLNLTGDGGFSGTAFVLGGRLAMNGAMPGAVADVGAGGEIGGSGGIGGLIVRNRATAAPGNSIGQLTVGTFVIFERGSTYAVEVDAAGANDRIEVTGVARLEGGTVQVMAEAGDYRPLTTYTILNAAGGVTGRFEGVTSNLAFLSPELAYDANAVTLTLVRNDLSFASAAASRNQAAVGEAVDQTFGYGDGVYDSLVRGTAAAAQEAFDQMSGEVHPALGAAAVQGGEQSRRAVLSRLTDARGSSGVHGWAAVGGSWGESRGEGGTASVDTSREGLMLGADRDLGDNFRIGVAAGFARTSVDVDARHASGEIETTQLLAYGGGEVGALSVRLGAGYAALSMDTRRSVSLRSASGVLTAETDATLGQAFVEVGREARFGALRVEPVIGLAALRYEADAFQEAGGETALRGAGDERDVLVGDLGVRLARTFGEADAVSTRLSVAWRRMLDGGESVSALAFAAGGPGFVVAAAPLDEDAVVIDAGVDWRISERLAAGATYQGAAGERTDDHALQARLSYRF